VRSFLRKRGIEAQRCTRHETRSVLYAFSLSLSLHFCMMMMMMMMSTSVVREETISRQLIHLIFQLKFHF
jgi:hypothetical protein